VSLTDPQQVATSSSMEKLWGTCLMDFGH